MLNFNQNTLLKQCNPGAKFRGMKKHPPVFRKLFYIYYKKKRIFFYRFLNLIWLLRKYSKYPIIKILTKKIKTSNKIINQNKQKNNAIAI
jgi:hypothetical protein